MADLLATQVCRDCGEAFPYDPDADYCPSCVQFNTTGVRTYEIVTAAIGFPVGRYDAEDAEAALDLFLQDLKAHPMVADEAQTALKWFATASRTDDDVQLKIGANVYRARRAVR